MIDKTITAKKFKNVRLFSGLSEEQRLELVGMSEEVLLDDQAALLKQHEQPRYLYLLLEGTLDVYHEESGESGERSQLGNINVGEIIGEMSFLDN